MYGSSILIIQAAPAEDVFSAAAAIQRARSQGLQVSSVILSNGLTPPTGLQKLFKRGISREAVVARQMASSQTAQLLGHQLIRFDTVRPAGSLWQRPSGLKAEIADAMAQSKAQTLWIPALSGDPEHDAIHLAAVSIKGNHEIYEYPVRQEDRGTPARFLTRAPELGLNLTLGEAAKRRRAIEIWSRILKELPVEADRELFRQLAPYDYRSQLSALYHAKARLKNTDATPLQVLQTFQAFLNTTS